MILLLRAGRECGRQAHMPERWTAQVQPDRLRQAGGATAAVYRLPLSPYVQLEYTTRRVPGRSGAVPARASLAG